MQGGEGMSEEPKERDALDERIDAALRRYVEAPEFSDARVVLARVRMLAEQEPRLSRVWVWAMPAGVAALIAVAAVVWIAQRPTAPQIAFVPKAPGVASVASPPKDAQQGKQGNAGPSTAVAPATSAQDDNGLSGSANVRRRQLGRNSVQRQNEVTVAERRLPKLQVFPAPEPLSAEERAAIAFMAQAPPDVKKQVVEAQEHLGDPIQIAAIEIRPLSDDDQQVQPKGKDMR